MSFISAELVLLSRCFRGLGKFVPRRPADPPRRPASRRIVGAEVPLCRKLPAASPESLAFVLDRRAIECAGRCCAPEREWAVRGTLRAVRRRWVIHGPGSSVAVLLLSSFSGSGRTADRCASASSRRYSGV